MAGGAYWRWYIGHTDIERVLVSSGDMLQKRVDKYRMVGWKQLTADDASVEVFTLDPGEKGDSHTALVTECNDVSEARERFCSFVEVAAAMFVVLKMPPEDPLHGEVQLE